MPPKFRSVICSFVWARAVNAGQSDVRCGRPESDAQRNPCATTACGDDAALDDGATRGCSMTMRESVVCESESEIELSMASCEIQG